MALGLVDASAAVPLAATMTVKVSVIDSGVVAG